MASYILMTSFNRRFSVQSQLDDLLKGLAAEPTDRSLSGLEGRIWQVVGERRAEMRVQSRLTPAAVVFVALALATGAVVGGLTELSAAPIAPDWMWASNLAPSALLEGAR